MSLLGQFFTEQVISNLLINKIDVVSPKRVLDLGIGDGSLTIAASNKWSNAEFYAIDIDPKRIINDKLPSSIKISCTNGLDVDIEKKINLKLGSVDVAICNPPYLKLNPEEKYKKILIETGFTSSIPLITTDIVFLAQNLRFLKHKGTLGIILPDGLLTSHFYSGFRKNLLENHTIEKIVQLPHKIFNNTEARTHIVILKKGKSNINNVVHLYKSDINGSYSSVITVKRDKLIYRMDYEFHSWVPNNNLTRTLNSINALISRGNLSRKDLLNSNITHFHTTDFKNHFKEAYFDEFRSPEKLIVAQKNDILIARVGARCIGKILIIKSGSIPISDCVYRVRVPEKYIEEVWQALNSQSTPDWFKAHAHGVCSQVISKQDLLNFQF